MWHPLPDIARSVGIPAFSRASAIMRAFSLAAPSSSFVDDIPLILGGSTSIGNREKPVTRLSDVSSLEPSPVFRRFSMRESVSGSSCWIVV